MSGVNYFSPSCNHYAAGWKTEGVVRPLEEINRLGREYVDMPEGCERERLLLDLCQAFHPYLMKYLVMICQGHVPVVGVGAMKERLRVNKDVEPFIRYFLPKGTPVNKSTLLTAVRHLHLAFKGMDTEEVYDVLMEQLLDVIQRYDPRYTEKVKLIVEVIDRELSKQKQFSTADVNRYLGLDSNRYLRMLCRPGLVT